MMTERSDNNIARRSTEEHEGGNIDLAASGVAYKERMNMPVLAAKVERQQPEQWREYFRERLTFTGMLHCSSLAGMILFMQSRKLINRLFNL